MLNHEDALEVTPWVPAIRLRIPVWISGNKFPVTYETTFSRIFDKGENLLRKRGRVVRPSDLLKSRVRGYLLID